MRFIATIAAAVLCFSGFAAQAGTIKGGPGFGGGVTVVDFEGFAEGTLIDTEYAGLGLSFTQDDGGTPMIDNLPQLFGYGPTSGVGMLTGSMTGGALFPTVAGMIVVFDTLQTRAGAFLSDTSALGPYDVTAFDGGGAVLETLTVLAAEFPSPGFFPPAASLGNAIFVGFEYGSPMIKSIQFGPGATFGDSFALDDLQFEGGVSAVPLPAGAVPALAALGLFAAFRRLRRRS